MYNVVRQQHVYTVLWCIKEVDRMRKIAVGVSLVGEVYPGSVILRVVVGVMRGNGTTIIRPLVRLICGEYKPDNELLAPGRSTQVTQRLHWTLRSQYSKYSSVSWRLWHGPSHWTRPSPAPSTPWLSSSSSPSDWITFSHSLSLRRKASPVLLRTPQYFKQTLKSSRTRKMHENHETETVFPMHYFKSL